MITPPPNGGIYGAEIVEWYGRLRERATAYEARGHDDGIAWELRVAADALEQLDWFLRHRLDELLP